MLERGCEKLRCGFGWWVNGACEDGADGGDHGCDGEVVGWMGMGGG